MTLAGSDNSVLTFTAPVLNSTGYLPLVLTYVQSSRTAATPTNWTGLDWLYYTSVECDTGLIVGLYCTPCPTGGYCPGGGRVWPLPGYWSFDERSVPVACSLPQACPGALCSPPTVKADGSRQTSVCAVGYAGSYCVECAADYYSDLQRCLSCGLEEQELTELVVLLCIFAALFLALAVAVATAHANKLSTAVSAVLVVQHLSVVGKLAGQQIPDSLTWLSELFTVLSMLNFDIQFVKPGCVVGALSFLTVYWCTIGLMCCVSLLFVAASAVRALLGRRVEMRERDASRTAAFAGGQPRSWRAHKPSAASSTSSSQEASSGLPWRWRFRARVVHSHLILGSILYLRLTTMGFQAIHCTDVLQSDGSYRSLLEIDMSTPCYVGAHLYSSLFIWPMLLLNSVAFPLLCFRLLYRSFHAAHVSSAVTPQPSSSVAPSPPIAPSARTIAAGGDKPAEQAVEMSKLDMTALMASVPQSPVDGMTPPVTSPQDVRGRRSISQPLFIQTPTGHLTSTPTLGEPATSRAIQLELQPAHSPASSKSLTSPPQHSTSIASSGTVKPISGHHRHYRTASEVALAVARSAFTNAQWRALSGSAKQLYRQLGKDTRRQEMFGYMYRQLKGELYYFRLLFFATSFGFAAVSVLPSDPTLRLFLTGVFLVFDLFTTCAMLPFERWWRNVLSVVLCWLTVVQVFVMLALVQLGLSMDGNSSVSLGHSTTAQQDSSDPSSSLTGDSDAAAQYELYLGIEVIVAMVAVGFVHRESVKLALRWLSGRTVSTWRLLCEWGSGRIERLRGPTRVTRLDVRPRLADELELEQPPMVVSDEAALAMVVLGRVEQLRQEEDERTADHTKTAVDGSWVRQHFDYIDFNTPRLSGSSSDRSSRGQRYALADPSLSPKSPTTELEMDALSASPRFSLAMTADPILGASLPRLILPSDAIDDSSISVAVSPNGTFGSHTTSPNFVISPRHGRMFNVSRQLSARIERSSPHQSPHRPASPYAASSHTRISSGPHTPQPSSPHAAVVSGSPTSQQASSPTQPSSRTRSVRVREARATLSGRVLNDGTRVLLSHHRITSIH